MTDRGRVTWSFGSLALFLSAVSTPSLAFMITAPTGGGGLEGRAIHHGRWDLGTDTSIGHVRYYWYREGEEPAASHHAQAALATTAMSVPPYGGVLVVPPEAIGIMRLLAVGEVTRGRLVRQEEFDEIVVTVEPSGELTGIGFETEKPWRLDTLGRLLEVPVVGQFGDGVTRRIGGSSSGSVYRSPMSRLSGSTGMACSKSSATGERWSRSRTVERWECWKSW